MGRARVGLGPNVRSRFGSGLRLRSNLLRHSGGGAAAGEAQQVAVERLGLTGRLLRLRPAERQQLPGHYERDDRVVQRLSCTEAMDKVSVTADE